ncbi:MAG: hypothetical protein PHT59_07850, partial [Candidatus Omnitrophica bacterium]|nr:hypothetical protein [Candidatus Omnitrophota bacterium]
MAGLASQTDNEELLPTFTNYGRSAGAVGSLIKIYDGPIVPAATGADTVLVVFTLPADFFNQSTGATIFIKVLAHLLNATSKTIKIIYNPTAAVVGSTVTGGTTLASSAAVTTNGGVSLNAFVNKVGIPNSNTQFGGADISQVVGVTPSLGAGAALTAVENAPILIAITGNA